MSDKDCLQGMSHAQISFLTQLDYLSTEELKQILLCEILPEKLLKKNDFEKYSTLDHNLRVPVKGIDDEKTNRV